MKELKLRGKQIFFAVAAILLIVGVVCGVVLNSNSQPVSKETPIKVKVLGIAENATGNSLVNGENIEEGEEASTTEVSRIAAKEPEKADVKVRNLNYANKNHTIRLELDGSDNFKVQNSTLTVDQIVVKVNDVVVNATKSFESGPEELNDGKNGKKYVLALTNVTGDGLLSITIPANTLTDEAGNSNSEITSTFDTSVIIDNTAPTRPICTASFVDGSGSYTSGTWTAKEVKTNIVAVDFGTGIEKFQYSVNDGEWTDCASIMPTGTDGGSYSNNTWTFATGKDDVIKFRAVDYLGNTSDVSNDFNIKYDNTAPTLTLAKDTYQEGFDGWTIPTGASVDNEGVLTINDVVAVWTPKYKTDGEKWYPEYDALSTTEVDNAGNGGVQNSLEYYNNGFELIDSDGVAFPIPVNQWGSSLTASRYRNQSTGNGGNIKYVQIGFALGTQYSQPVVKVKNFKMHGQLYTEFYDINLTPNGTYSDIAIAKFAKGNQAKSYFASAGTNIENNTFRVTENGTYTVYVEDEAGNSTVATIEVTKIDKTAPVIEANDEFNGTSISFTAKDIAPDDNETPSGVVGYQITNSQTAPTSGWIDVEVPSIETVDGHKQTSQTVSVSNSELSAGTNYIWVIDAAGHKTYKEITVSYNLTYDYQDNDTYTKAFLDTGYTIDWSKKFRVEETFKVGTLGQRYLLFGNYPTRGTLNVEVTAENKIRVFITDSTTNTAIVDAKSTTTIANNEDISLIFEWNASTKKYSLVATGTTTNITMNSDTVNITRAAEQALRVGQDYRDSTYETFKTLNVTAFKIIENIPDAAGVSTLPTPAKQGYRFRGWYTEPTEGVQKTSVTNLKTNMTLYGRLKDIDAPTINIEGGVELYKTTTDGQTVTLKGSDGTGVTGYYWGTTEPTSATDCSITTAADLAAITSNAGLNKTINAAGTYWFACRDAAGNMNKKSITIASYVVNSLLENIAGERNTYTNENYTSIGSATYIVRSGTSLTALEEALIPTGATVDTYRGYSTEFSATPASVETGHSPEATDATTYYVWFNRLAYTVTVKKNANGGIMAETVGLQNNNVTVGSDSASDKTLSVKYGDTVRATAEPNAGYTFTGWSGGYVSGTTNPVVGGEVTENKEISATYADTTAPIVDDIAGGITEKIKATDGQTVLLKARDGVGITGYYWGTTEPTSAESCTTTTSADLTAITSNAGLNQTINAAGTYWFACRDAAGNWDKKSITFVSYTVNNLLENIDGVTNTYTNANYSSAINETYIVKEGTSLKYKKLGSLPDGAGATTYKGCSTVYSTTPATLDEDSEGAITIANGTTYYMWYNRRAFTISLSKNEKGSITATTVTQPGNTVTVAASAASDGSLQAKYGDSVRVTATAQDGYVFEGWSGGYVSGNTNPATGTEIFENKTVTASYTYTATPVITRTAYNAFSVSAPSASRYIISKTQTSKPGAGASGWSTTATKTTSTSAKETWYVWVKDSSGVVSQNYATITNYKVTLTAGTGTTLTAKADGNTQSSPGVTNQMYVLDGTPVYPIGATSTGYNSLVVKKGDSVIENSAAQTINEDTTFTTSATENVVTINIKKDDVAWPASGIKVTLYNGATPTAYTAIVSESGVSSATFTTVPNGTYKVYAGKDNLDPENLIDSQLQVTVNNNSPSAITLDYYSLTLRTGNGVESVLADDIWSYVEVERQYLNAQQSINISAYLEEGYSFDKWTPGEYLPDNFTATSEMQSIRMVAHPVTLTASGHDITAPEVLIDGGTDLKAASQTVKLKGSDGVGITAYYWGTTEPTSVESCTTTTSADISAITSDDGLSKTISSTGTYWFACRDAVGNWDKKSITIVSYTINNLLENIAGARDVYKNTNYSSESSNTYIVKAGTSLTTSEVAQIPTGASADTYKGYSTSYSSSTATLQTGHAPEAVNGTTYYIWFDRLTYTVTLTKNANGGIMAETVTLTGNSVSVASGSTSNKTLTVKYGDTVRVTAQPNSGYTFSSWSGGYVSGSTNPKVGGQVTANKTVTATFVDNTAPRIKVQAYKYSSTATNNVGTSLKSESTFDEDGTYTVSSSWLNEGVTFKFTVSDAAGVTKTTWKCNATGTYTDTGSTYSSNGSWTNGGTNGIRYLTLTDAGYRKAQYCAEDAAGNKTTVTVVAKIDKSSPSLSGTVTANIDGANQLTFNLSISSFSDVGSGISGYGVFDGTTQLVGVTSTKTSGTETIELSSNTDWYTKDLTVKAIDKAGNKSSGVSISYYTVKNVSGLTGLATCVNTASATETSDKMRFKGRTVKQTANISYPSNGTLTPIGYRGVNSSNAETNYGFEGTYDGQSYTITGFYLPNTQNIVENGLFGYTKNATIKNVKVTIAKRSGTQTGVSYSSKNSATIGGIVGTADNTSISNCTTSGYIVSYIRATKDKKAYIGGICARAQSGTVITGCTNGANITTEGNTYSGDDSEVKVYTGGIAGYTSTDSKVKTSVINNGTVKGTFDTGGIVAYANGEVSGCTNNGTVSSDNALGYKAEALGGIVGRADSPSYCTISNCTNTATISSYGITSDGYANLGGIVGKNDGVTITSATNNGDVSTLRGSLVGGIVGYNNGGQIKNSTNNNHVLYNYNNNNEFACMGGIAGKNYGGTISDCSSSNAVSTMNYKIQRIGGIVGQNTNNGSKTATIKDCSVVCDILAYQYVGGIAGENVNGTISGCTVDTETEKDIVGAVKFVGGIAGSNGGTISNCEVGKKYIIGRNTGGGIAGNNTGRIESCKVLASNDALFVDEPAASDSSITYQYIGGIVGTNSGHIIGSQFLAKIGATSTATTSKYSEVGGIAGNSSGTVTSCLVNSSKIAGNSKVGGIVGNNSGEISECGTKGNIYAYSTGNAYVGGIAGDNVGHILTSYNRANVGSTTQYVKYSGGIAGENGRNATLVGRIEYCYNGGTIYGLDRTGGISGNNNSTLENCYNRSRSYNVSTNTNYEITGNDNGGTCNRCYYRSVYPNGNTMGTAVADSYLQTTIVSDYSDYFKKDKSPSINGGCAILFWE